MAVAEVKSDNNNKKQGIMLRWKGCGGQQRLMDDKAQEYGPHQGLTALTSDKLETIFNNQYVRILRYYSDRRVVLFFFIYFHFPVLLFKG